MDLSEHQAWWNQQLALRQAEYERNLAIAAEAEAKRLAEEKAAAEAALAAEKLKAQQEAQKAADFTALKGLVDKVYFAYTLQRADDTQLTDWTQQLTDGASVTSVVAGIRSSLSSMYFGAGAEVSIDNAYQTLYGRSATLAEKAALAGIDPVLVPGVIALNAANTDAETMGLRMQFSQAVKEYYEATGIPLTYGMPMMKAKEQMQTLKVGADSINLVNKAVREMGDFLAEWGRTIKKPEDAQSDIESPKAEYFFKDAPEVGVAFYEPATSNNNGRLLFTFNEPVDWSEMDKNKNGVLEYGTELKLLLSNPGILGSNPVVRVDKGVTTLIIEIGDRPSIPNMFDGITFYNVSDYQGNSGAATFGVATSSGSIGVFGSVVSLSFASIVDWSAVDEDKDGKISLSDFGGAGELQLVGSAGDPKVDPLTGSAADLIEIDGSQTLVLEYSGNSIRLGLRDSAGDSIVKTQGSITLTGLVDMSGNEFSASFVWPAA